MKRWQGYVVAVFALIVAGEAYVYAQPAPPNCGLNMLCRIRTLVVRQDSTFSGDAGVAGAVTITGTLRAGSTQNGGAVTLDGAGAGTFTTYSTAHCSCTSQTQGLTPVSCSAPSGGVVTIGGAAGETVGYTCL